MKAKEFLDKISMTGYSKSTRKKIFEAGREDEEVIDQVAKLLDNTTSEEELLKALEQIDPELSELAMLRQKRLKEYKQEVRHCLLTLQHRTAQEADRLMKKYDQDFAELLSWNCTPQEASGIILSGLY